MNTPLGPRAGTCTSCSEAVDYVIARIAVVFVKQIFYFMHYFMLCSWNDIQIRVYLVTYTLKEVSIKLINRQEKYC